MGDMRRAPADQPILITSAPQSADDEYDRRRKRYAIMMAGRALCVLGAVLVANVSLLLSLAFIVGGAVLPWCAVLIANDRPPKAKAQPMPFYDRPVERALPGDSERTVDG